MSKILKIAIVVGETSGDNLAASLLEALQRYVQDLCSDESVEFEFLGIGGEAMQSKGFNSVFDMELLNVMGLIDPLKRLPRLLRLKNQLVELFVNEGVDLFIGVDAPDFNLRLAKTLKQRGITTVHYVCPSVWAWRESRVKTIKRATDQVLAILPFEEDYLAQRGIKASFVGHPLTEKIAAYQRVYDSKTSSDQEQASAATQLCIMPGSRMGEVTQHLSLFLQAALKLSQSGMLLDIEIPVANVSVKAYIEQAVQVFKDQHHLKITLTDDSWQSILGSDIVLAASGTSALEIALFGKPMVVAYKVGSATYHLLKPLVSAERFSLPNIILGEDFVPELIQYEATAENIFNELSVLIKSKELRTAQLEKFKLIAERMSVDKSKVAQVVFDILADGAQ